MRIWKRLNLCKTFWSGERSCLIVAMIFIMPNVWLRCDKVKYFSYHFLKSVWRFLFCLDENIFTLTFWTDGKKCSMKKKIFYVCRDVEWNYSDIILLQLVWIVCRDVELLTNILYFCKCYTMWLIVNKIRKFVINFSRMFARSNNILMMYLLWLFLT